MRRKKRREKRGRKKKTRGEIIRESERERDEPKVE